ncbi:hypothetical protein PR202_gb05976 [Eleusine coracana subsp. coracana]|uniref:Uncharacterized protein n=1 Tax=Eleusine coracana subsp. coracana TaxID=191504 RepID=A0AAV5E8H4_ELECO|nr:hypothetical protein PR202_gb05976 [Eleusine coracana subsp. coracana]
MVDDDGDDLLMNNWPDLDEGLLVDQLAAQVFNNPVIGHDVEDAFEASSSLGCYELSSSDAVLQSLTSNNAAACHFTTDTTTNLSFCTADMPPPVLPSSDDFLLFGAGLPPGPPQASSSMAYTDQEPPEKPGQDMETRMKQREKRQLAKQRYNDKKKNRRFGKQIMYESLALIAMAWLCFSTKMAAAQPLASWLPKQQDDDPAMPGLPLPSPSHNEFNQPDSPLQEFPPHQEYEAPEPAMPASELETPVPSPPQDQRSPPPPQTVPSFPLPPPREINNPATAWTTMLVFGDSMVDPGNNNQLQTAAKANFLP